MPVTFPPYGYMSDQLMTDWSNDRKPAIFPGSQTEWDDYATNLIAEMSDFLWPRWDFAGQQWSGAAAAAMQDLSQADLDLMQTEIAGRLDSDVICNGRNLGIKHRELFGGPNRGGEKNEDPADFTASFNCYLQIPANDQDAAAKQFLNTAKNEIGNSALRFKHEFQRPRAYQVSWLIGRRFSHQEAVSAATPSMMSGHCFKGVLGCVGVYLKMRGSVLSAAAIDDLRQLAVDIGDRRVFAGVHYPSDNIASWFMCLRMCDVLYGNQSQDAKDFIVSAIQRSFVFQVLGQSTKPGAPHDVPLQKLKQEMARPATGHGAIQWFSVSMGQKPSRLYPFL